jgi:F0F1-type ATP synthase membrane subunit b/b'
MRRALRCAGFIVLFFYIEITPVLAQEGESSPADSTTGWVFRWLNFAIVFGAIAYFAVKKGAPYFRANAKEISGKIADAARVREEAEQKRREAAAKLANLDQEIAQLREDAKRNAEFEALRIRILVREESEIIERAAKAEIAAAERAARLELKVLAARLALQRAEALLREELTPKAEAALFRTFVRDLGRDVN